MQDHTGVERAAPRTHHQTVKRGEAHRRGDASQVVHRTQTCAAAEVRDDRAPARGVAVPLQQARLSCTRTTGRETRTDAPRAPTAHTATASSVRSPVMSDGMRCRSTRPAGVAAVRSAERRSPPTRTVGAVGRGECSSSVRPARGCRRGPVPRTWLPPCTTRWATAAGGCPPVRLSTTARTCCSAAWYEVLPSSASVTDAPSGSTSRADFPPIPSTMPAHSGLRGRGSTAASNSANLMLDDPQFRTRIGVLTSVAPTPQASPRLPG